MKKLKTDPVFKVGQHIINNAVNGLAREAVLNDEAIHNLRVTCKKIRALLRVYLPHVHTSAIKPVDREVKALADAYSSSRDTTVIHNTLKQLYACYSTTDAPELLKLLDYFPVLSPNSPEHTDTHPSDKLEVILSRWKKQLYSDAPDSFAKGIQYSHLKVRKLARTARSSGKGDHYHQCRKWVKYHLYQIRLSGQYREKATEIHRQQLKQLAERLGIFHDHCVLETQLQELLCSGSLTSTALTTGIQQVLDWLQQEKSADKKTCDRLFDLLFSSKRCPIADCVDS